MSRLSAASVLLSIVVAVFTYGCSAMPDKLVQTPHDIVLRIVDVPEMPLIEAELYGDAENPNIRGKVFKRSKTSLNGYALVKVFKREQLIWQRRLELHPAGVRLFRYRYFDEELPGVAPGDRISVEYEPKGAE